MFIHIGNFINSDHRNSSVYIFDFFMFKIRILWYLNKEIDVSYLYIAVACFTMDISLPRPRACNMCRCALHSTVVLYIIIYLCKNIWTFMGE